MLSRRHLRLLIGLLLPLLTLRALLPVGYMVAVADGDLGIVMCSDGLPASSIPAGDAPARHHGSDPLPDHADDCPFAHATVHAPPPQRLEGPRPPAPESRFVSRSLVHLAPTTGPPRATGARAPPITADSLA